MRDGNEASGDGWEFRDRGLNQTTGRDAWQAVATTLGESIIDAASYMETPAGVGEAACLDRHNMKWPPLADAWNLKD